MPTVDETDTTAMPTSNEMRAPVKQPRQDVAAELVETERMREAGRFEPLRQLLRRRDRTAHSNGPASAATDRDEHDGGPDADSVSRT